MINRKWKSFFICIWSITLWFRINVLTKN